MSAIGKLFGLILCVFAIESGRSEWADCPVDGGSIPAALVFAGLSGLLFILPGYFAMIRPEIQLTLAIYNSTRLIRNLNNLFTMVVDDQDRLSPRYCNHPLVLTAILSNVIVLAGWFHRLIILAVFITNRERPLNMDS